MIAARWLALAAVLGGVVGVLYFPLHSLAYFGTGEPQGAVEWAAGGRDLFEPLLDWGSAEDVYKTYGRVGVLVVLGFLCGLIALRAHRGSAPRGLERWASASRSSAIRSSSSARSWSTSRRTSTSVSWPSPVRASSSR